MSHLIFELNPRIILQETDITKLVVDAIVNAANNRLAGGSGVDGAIHRAAGKELAEYCQTLGGCATGEACITPGFLLPASYIIHTVGPIWQGGNDNEDILLASCYRKSLRLALKYELKTIAFSAISTGVYGFPFERACRIALQEITHFQCLHSLPEKVILVCFGRLAFDAYKQVAEEFMTA